MGEQIDVGSGKIEVPVRKLFRFEGSFEGKTVSILADDGCSSNIISKEFIEQNETLFKTRLKKTNIRIEHSKSDSTEEPMGGMENGTVSFQGHEYTSNWVVADSRYDIILGMPWHEEMNVRKNYHQREVFVKSLRLQEEETNSDKIRVSNISVKKFRRGIRTNQFIEIFAVRAVTGKVKTGRPLKDSISNQAEDAFQKLLNNHENEAEIVELLTEYAEIFKSKLPAGLPPKREVDHRIDIKEGCQPPFRKLYQLSPAELLAAKEYIEENLKSGKIRPSKSPYGSPMFFAKEKDGTLRGVVDYRAVNHITKRNSTAIPRTDEMFDRLGRAKYFSKIDMKTGFHQIRVHPDDVEKTAFTTKYGQFEYLVMAIGLCNAPATFQTLMNSIFFDHIDSFIVVYIDDLLIFSKTKDEHIQHLRIVFERLRENKLFISPKKCEFMKSELNS